MPFPPPPANPLSSSILVLTRIPGRGSEKGGGGELYVLLVLTITPDTFFDSF